MEWEIKGSVALIGDIHGTYDDWRYPKVDADNFVFLGDIGFGFFKTKRFCENLDVEIPEGVECYFIRGNHDNPEMWHSMADEIHAMVPRFHMVRDYDTMLIEGKKYLCIGGGISIDRNYRIIDVSYWIDEAILNPPEKTIPDIYGIFSHTGFTPPTITHKDSFIKLFPDVKRDCQHEQDVLKKIYHKYRPKVWYNGHFHVHQEFKYEDCDVIQLDCNEPYLLIGK